MTPRRSLVLVAVCALVLARTLLAQGPTQELIPQLPRQSSAPLPGSAMDGATLQTSSRDPFRGSVAQVMDSHVRVPAPTFWQSLHQQTRVMLGSASIS